MRGLTDLLRACKLISLDIGGTLGRANGETLTSKLVEKCKLPKQQAVAIIRNTLHVAPEISKELVETLCNQLQIPISAFPSEYEPPPLKFFDASAAAVESLSTFAPLVTLTNVCCLDYTPQAVTSVLGRFIHAQFASCAIGAAKPDREAFRAVSSHCNVGLTDLVHVGDDWTCDVLGALAAGANVIWISNGRAKPSQLSPAEDMRVVTVRSVADFSSLTN